MKSNENLLVEVRKSSIHNKGVFAKVDIPKGVKIIEYLGDKITKAESEKRAIAPLKKSKLSDKHGAVYIFTLNSRFDIDGNVPHNKARFINHSCDPNCETQIINKRIWIVSLKRIKKDEEISYNYGYDIDDYEEHVCKCGAKNCAGYILDKNLWKKIKQNKTLKKT